MTERIWVKRTLGRRRLVKPVILYTILELLMMSPSIELATTCTSTVFVSRYACIQVVLTLQRIPSEKIVHRHKDIEVAMYSEWRACAVGPMFILAHIQGRERCSDHGRGIGLPTPANLSRCKGEIENDPSLFIY